MGDKIRKGNIIYIYINIRKERGGENTKNNTVGNRKKEKKRGKCQKVHKVVYKDEEALITFLKALTFPFVLL